MTSVKGAILVTIFSNVIMKLIAFASSIVLARILTPTDIGTFSVAIAFVALAQMFRDLGIGSYLVQEKELTQSRFRSAASITLIAAWSMGLLLLALKEVIAGFYKEPGLASIVQVLAINFFIIPLASPILSLLKRYMEFKALAGIHLAAAVVHSITSIGFAVAGYGYMSLAYGAVAGIITTFLSATALWPRARMGSRLVCLIPHFMEWRHILPFSTKSFSTNLLGTLGEHTSDFVIGRIFGFHALGIYSRGQGLVEHMNGILFNAIQAVAFPRFSELLRDGEDLKEPYLRGLSYLTLMQWPAFIFAALFAQPIILLLFGSQWVEAAPFLQLLAIGGIFSTLSGLAPGLLLSMGEAGYTLRAQSHIQLIRILLILLAATQGLIWVAVAQIITYLFQMYIYSKYIKKILKLNYTAVFSALAGSMKITLVCTLPGYLVFRYWLQEIDFKAMLVCSVITFFLWIASIWFFKHPFRNELKRFGLN
ncbi:MAG: lipopolysaccharide biosynthesis protein [Pseudomonadales bacterium]|nr:lipopolysaccharide biosynthesis protein [Pseudomonadales bacterium]